MDPTVSDYGTKHSWTIYNLTMELNTAGLYSTWLWKLNTAGPYSTWLSPSFLHLQNVPPIYLGRSHIEFFTKRSVNRRFFCLSHETVDGNKALIYNSQTNFPFQHLIYTFHQLSGRKRFKRQSGYSMTTCLTVGSKFSKKGQVKRTQWMRVLERMGLSLLLYFITHYPWINTSHLL